MEFEDIEASAVKGAGLRGPMPMEQSKGEEWWNVESGLTPTKLDQVIDVVNKLNDVFGK